MYIDINNYVTNYRGIGLMVARRLLSEVSSPNKPIRLCLACRNKEKAYNTRRQLLKDNPRACIDVISVDTSSPQSARAAALELKEKY